MPSPTSRLRAPLLWILLPMIAGLAAAKHYDAPAGSLGLLIVVAGALVTLAIIASFSRHWLGHATWSVSLFCGVTIAGFVFLHLRYPSLHHVDERPTREITVVVEALQVFPLAPSARSITGLGKIVGCDSEPEAIGRRIYFSAIRRISVIPQRSGHYTLTGVFEPITLKEDSDGFEVYLDNLGIRQQLTRAHIKNATKPPAAFSAFCERAKDRLEKILRHGVNRHPQILSVYLAMLLGEKAVLSPEQENAFMRSGTFHIFSISGLHVGVIALALHGVLQFLRVPRRIAVVINLLALWLYVQITGGSSPAERAFLMIAFFLGAQVFRLPGNGLAALVAAAVFTLLIDPLQLFSAGFQMSYTVVIALVVMGVPLGRKWLDAWKPFSFLPKQNWNGWQHGVEHVGRWFLGSMAASWVAFLASTPAGVGYFKILSLGSLAANLLIIPFSTLAIIAGFLSLLTGLIGMWPLSALFNSAAMLILIATDWLVRHGTVLPGVYFNTQFRSLWMTPVAMSALIAVMLACMAGGWRKRYGGYWPPFVLLVLIVIFGVKFSPS